jgi:hypothetical protein
MAALAGLTKVHLALSGHGSLGCSTFCLFCRALIGTIGEVLGVHKPLNLGDDGSSVEHIG